MCLQNLAVSYISLERFCVCRQIHLSRLIKFDEVRAELEQPSSAATQKMGTAACRIVPSRGNIARKEFFQLNVLIWALGSLVLPTMSQRHLVEGTSYAAEVKIKTSLTGRAQRDCLGSGRCCFVEEFCHDLH